VSSKDRTQAQPIPRTAVDAKVEILTEILEKISTLHALMSEKFSTVIMALAVLPRYHHQTPTDLQQLVLEPPIRDRVTIAHPAGTEHCLQLDISGFAVWATKLLLLPAATVLFASTAFSDSRSCGQEIIAASNIPEEGRPHRLCASEADTWNLRLHDIAGKTSFLTNGTALNIFHASDIENPALPIALIPASDGVWSLRYIRNGTISEWNNNEEFFIWSPGGAPNSAANIDWESGEPRFFRCLDHDGFQCITYYHLSHCENSDANTSGSGFILSVRKKIDARSEDIFADYDGVDSLIQDVRDLAADELCEEDQK
jgi:hypothetical protein